MSPPLGIDKIGYTNKFKRRYRRLDRRMRAEVDTLTTTWSARSTTPTSRSRSRRRNDGRIEAPGVERLDGASRRRDRRRRTDGRHGGLRSRERGVAGGVRVVLLERKPGLCKEASCTNTGALMLQLIRAAFIPHALRMIELWRTAPEWLGADMGYVQNGGLTVAYDDDEAQKFDGWMDDRRAAGAPVEIISRGRARALEPALTDRIALASYSELDGFADAKLTGAGFRRGLARARVDIRAPVRVSGIEREEHRFAIIHEAGTVRIEPRTRVRVCGVARPRRRRGGDPAAASAPAARAPLNRAQSSSAAGLNSATSWCWMVAGTGW